MDRPIGATHEAQLNSWTGSDASIDLVKDWLRDCIEYHSVCQNIQPSTRQPKRLLCLDGEPTDIVRIHTFEQACPIDAQYVTLTHRWGDPPPPTLQALSGDQLRPESYVKHFPQTFKDAIDVTRRLGFQYWWIDLLCIQQDSKEDWTQQSAIMGDVYRGGVLNISASGGMNSHAGLFVEESA